MLLAVDHVNSMYDLHALRFGPPAPWLLAEPFLCDQAFLATTVVPSIRHVLHVELLYATTTDHGTMLVLAIVRYNCRQMPGKWKIPSPMHAKPGKGPTSGLESHSCTLNMVSKP